MKALKFLQILFIITPVFLSGCKKLTEEENCTIPANLRLLDRTNTTMKVAWDGVTDAQQYRISIRKAGTTAYTEAPVTSSVYEFTNLVENTSYEVKVQANCSGSNSIYSTVLNLKTKSNYETYIVKKWKITKWVENQIPFAVTGAEYIDFKSAGSYELSFPGMPSSGTWTLSSDLSKLTLVTGPDTKIWSVNDIQQNSALFTKANTTSTDTLQLVPF